MAGWAPLLLLTLAGVGSYTEYRLEKLCPVDGSKSRLKMADTAASFHLNSSLLPGSHFTCHLELILASSKSGFLVYFDSMNLAEPTNGECEMDYVQFGRDILFITSYRSTKYCGRITGSLPRVPAPRTPGNRTGGQEESPPVTPLTSRVYSESSDQEMDIWLQLAVPPADWPGHKTLSLTVTPFRKSCSPTDRSHKRCGPAQRHCIRRELFCDGRINCALPSQRAGDETACTRTAAPPVSDSALWQEAGLPHAAGLFFFLLFMAVVAVYIVKTLQQKKALKAAPVTSQLDRRYERSLVDPDYDSGLIVPVGRRPLRPAPPLPPPYTDSVARDPPFAPGYSYASQ